MLISSLTTLPFKGLSGPYTLLLLKQDMGRGPSVMLHVVLQDWGQVSVPDSAPSASHGSVRVLCTLEQGRKASDVAVHDK